MSNTPDNDTSTDLIVPITSPEDESPGLSIYDLFDTDVSAEEDGRWFNDYFGEGADGDVKMRGFASKMSQSVRRRLEAHFHKDMKNDGSYPKEIAEKMVTEQLVQAIIVDWRGKIFQHRDGTPIPFSQETARALMVKLPHLRNKLALSAGRLDGFRREVQAATTKN